MLVDLVICVVIRLFCFWGGFYVKIDSSPVVLFKVKGDSDPVFAE